MGLTKIGFLLGLDLRFTRRHSFPTIEHGVDTQSD